MVGRRCNPGRLPRRTTGGARRRDRARSRQYHRDASRSAVRPRRAFRAPVDALDTRIRICAPKAPLALLLLAVLGEARADASELVAIQYMRRAELRGVPVLRGERFHFSGEAQRAVERRAERHHAMVREQARATATERGDGVQCEL